MQRLEVAALVENKKLPRKFEMASPKVVGEILSLEVLVIDPERKPWLREFKDPARARSAHASSHPSRKDHNTR